MHDWFAMWSLSEKIAAIAGAAGLLQFLALISTIVVMVRNGRRQLRAYIFVENAWINQDSEDGSWKIKYRLKNFGGTPASKTKIVDIAKVVDFPMTVLPIPIERDYFGPVAPNGDFIECETKSVTGITIGEIKAETKAIVLVGKITYEDVFKRKRVTDFCFSSLGVQSIGDEMSVYESGNDST